MRKVKAFLLLLLLNSCYLSENLKYNQMYVDYEENRYRQYYKLNDGFSNPYDYSVVDY